MHRQLCGKPPVTALARLRKGHASFGTLQSLPTSIVTEIAVLSGYDFVILDCEHTVLDERSHVASLQVISGSDAFGVVRVRQQDFSAVGRYLDLGADGILLPDVQSASEAREFVAAATLGPKGTRSSTGGSARALRYGIGGKVPAARPLLLAMIEGAAAVAAIDEIAATPGLDGLVIGPNDLAADLGTTDDFSTTEYAQAFRAVERAATRAGLILGTRAHRGYPVERLLKSGHRFILVDADVAALREGYRSNLDAAKGAGANLNPG